MILGNHVVSSSGRLLKIHKTYPKIPFNWDIVTNADFEQDYSNSTRLGTITSSGQAIKIPSQPKAGKLVNEIWNGANSYTKHITFTDESDFTLTRFDTSNNNATVRNALLSITNIPPSVKNLGIVAPNITKVSSVENITSLRFTNNAVMANLNSIIGLSNNSNITSLNLQENTGLTDLSGFIIPENLTTLRAMFQGCSSLKKARIDYNYSGSAMSLMFQRTALKHLDIYADDIQSDLMFQGYSPASVVKVRCVPNTNTWSFWKSNLEANISPNSVDRTKYILHSFDANPKSINIWGDSLTQGGDGTTYSDLCVKLSNMLTADAVVHNCGQGGSSAATRKGYFSTYDIGWNDITVLFFGHNSPYTTIETYNESYIPHLNKYIVLGLVTKNYSTSMNNQMASEYGEHFVDTHAYMVANGFAITGLTPTTQDEEDLANGNVPHSFLASDYIHINEYGGLIVATAIKEKLLSLGYIDNTWLATI